MCGIVGYVGDKPAAQVMLPALKRLEYRGYDSAGVALLDGRRLTVRRAVGKLANLEELLNGGGAEGCLGIGHTRWATHGKVTEANAHPHVAGAVAVIHNGIIENFLELRADIEAAGRTLLSETDTEVIAHLVDAGCAQGLSLVEAVRAAVARLSGSFAIVAIHEREPGRLVAAKTATPIVIGLGEGENFVASDVPALLEHTRRVLYLEDGEIADITGDGVTVTGFDGAVHRREPTVIEWDAATARKGGYPHFLLKEIHEQPHAVGDTLRGRIDGIRGEVQIAELAALEGWLQQAGSGPGPVQLVGCGTAWHACLVGKHWLGELAGLRAEADYGSEFRYRNPAPGHGELLVAVSQSGETADTLGSLEAAQRGGASTFAVCNVVDSSIARRAGAVMYTQAGPEISVCSSKAFTTQLTALLLMSLQIGRRLGTGDRAARREIERSLRDLPGCLQAALAACRPRGRPARRASRPRRASSPGRGTCCSWAAASTIRSRSRAR